MAVRIFAPAKINLALHVSGQRADGYHLLDSLVAFAPVGDVLTMSRADGLSLTVDGPEGAGLPADMDNLALRAAALMADGSGFALKLTKNLPAASGIGGGSADAAAALRGAMALMGDAALAARADDTDDATDPLAEQVLALGADVPMCLFSQPCRVRGIGERIDFVTLPRVAAVLVNPRVPVSTPEVFRRLVQKNNAPMPATLPHFGDVAALIAFLRGQRNDLEAPAIATQPVIAEVLAAIAGTRDCALARMSGSGATCFGLFASDADAKAAAAALANARPDWWVTAGALGDWSQKAMPAH